MLCLPSFAIIGGDGGGGGGGVVREIKKYNVFTHCCIKESIIQRMCFNVIR